MLEENSRDSSGRRSLLCGWGEIKTIPRCRGNKASRVSPGCDLDSVRAPSPKGPVLTLLRIQKPYGGRLKGVTPQSLNLLEGRTRGMTTRLQVRH